MKVTTEKTESQRQNDLLKVYFLMKEKYPNASEIYMYQFENEVFLYKPLGRKHYKMLINSEVDVFSKEDAVCKECVVYPENYDFDNCEAGLPSALAKVILENSCLTDPNIRQALIDQYRAEMFDLDNQITCMIHEAYPEYPIEEIENWDMQKTALYASRAEWILANFRNAEFTRDPFTGESLEDAKARKEAIQAKQKQQAIQQEVETIEKIEETKANIGETIEQRQKRLKNKLKKDKITPEQLTALKEKYPELKIDSSNFSETF